MSDIDRLMQQDGFWNNPTQHASIMQQRRQLERQIGVINDLKLAQRGPVVEKNPQRGRMVPQRLRGRRNDNSLRFNRLTAFLPLC